MKQFNFSNCTYKEREAQKDKIIFPFHTHNLIADLEFQPKYAEFFVISLSSKQI